MSDQAAVDQSNRQFWQHICGSKDARRFGFDGDDTRSIVNFDSWFFDFFPYLDRYIPFEDLSGRDVLEIGLGYGSVSQRLAEAGAKLTGLDIAQAPVHWLRYRLGLKNLSGEAIQGSALAIPFGDESFDYVVSIGCLHHTGNLEKAISEVRRVLRPGGRATIMIYNATSYKQWIKHPLRTLQYSKEVLLGSDKAQSLTADRRAEFDVDAEGNIAPEVVLCSKTSLSRMLASFSTTRIYRTNVLNGAPIIRHIPRGFLNAVLGPLFGHDLYALVTK